MKACADDQQCFVNVLVESKRMMGTGDASVQR
jgi:hypothetical protein